ncbi:periplasmic amino acid-binding protein [Herbaspirillum sp. GW103]|uniref:substrate-binding periplasmic protein n=1 Tax=unclassified Herbaspirillum TaxID=2624150 RepID=UPI00025E2700|nr:MULTISPECIES: transporter substrate-binding domain-containing protein [unclassified Herbaspirillum]EIJ45868.1 periplasmic amino acid-binding protein [Herbaspirillum sp. GW103]MCI1003304.1 transporter substrate-binding domain-containing protein [Herbaspirillum sp. C7C8]
MHTPSCATALAVFTVLTALTALTAPPTVQAADCSKVVISADSDYAPLHWYDGKRLTGASIEIATRALSALNIPYEVRYVGPFHRVLKEAESGEVAMVSSLKNTPERQQYLAFASVPLFVNPIAVFVARDKHFAYAGWKDLVGKRGAITLGNQFGGGFDEFLRDHLTIETAQKFYMNFTKLDSGRIDYLITGYYNGMIYLNQTGQTDRFMPLRPFVSESDNYIAMSRASPCVKLLPRINAQLEAMQKRGELRAVLQSFETDLRIDTANPADGDRAR